MLWMIGEIGEVVDIVKKHGGVNASTDAELKKDLIEELADVLMYYNDVVLCYKPRKSFRFLLPVFIWTHMIMLSELPAKIARACKSRFFCNGRNGFLSSIKLFGSLRQSVLDEIRHWRNMDTRLKNM